MSGATNPLVVPAGTQPELVIEPAAELVVEQPGPASDIDLPASEIDERPLDEPTADPDQPTTDGPTTDGPVADDSTADQGDEPTTAGPIADQSTADQGDEPATDGPIADQSTADQGDEPATDGPATDAVSVHEEGLRPSESLPGQVDYQAGVDRVDRSLGPDADVRLERASSPEPAPIENAPIENAPIENEGQTDAGWETGSEPLDVIETRLTELQAVTRTLADGIKEAAGWVASAKARRAEEMISQRDAEAALAEAMAQAQIALHDAQLQSRSIIAEAKGQAESILADALRPVVDAAEAAKLRNALDAFTHSNAALLEELAIVTKTLAAERDAAAARAGNPRSPDTYWEAGS